MLSARAVNPGLIRAAERFGATRGVQFVSDAVWYICRAMLQAIADHGRSVRVPLGRLRSGASVWRPGRGAITRGLA